MLFNSIEFLILMGLLIPSYYLARTVFWQHSLLLITSLFFYAWWNLPYLALLILSALITAQLSKLLDITTAISRRKQILIIGVSGNLLILCIFKYYNFFVDTLDDFNIVQLRYAELLLPLGISFYTFQSLSYLIDVYRGKLKAERNPLKVLLYVAFFPQLVAGPIVRATDFLPQLINKHNIKWDDIVVGGRRILMGLLKKVVIADNISLLVDPVYLAPNEYSGLALVVATYAFAIQIYCDFSGYSDIAIGVARMLGFRLNENFNFPYISQSIQEFWKRWHISLSSWLRDYLYIPLGGSRLGKHKTYRNLLITMLLGGLWHGASYNFLIWGALHGFWLSLERYLSKNKKNETSKNTVRIKQGLFNQALRMFLVFHGVCITWVFFRAQTLPDALDVFVGIFTWQAGANLPIFQIAWQCGLIIIVGSYFAITYKLSHDSKTWYPAAASACLSIILFGTSSSEFIYFVF
jgi:D-alanyl-lipoteichoic acid acyltransferase DltB (MBOAT superfamily)